MPKSEDVAMFMQPVFNNIQFLFPKEFQPDGFLKQSADEPFSERVIEFLNAWSQQLNKEDQIRDYPDVATFAFFCRRANVVHLKNHHHNPQTLRIGRGMVFHIAPSNVPVNFAYSLVAGLLAGNFNVVRVPSKDFAQVDLILNSLQKIAATSDFTDIVQRILLVKYDRQNQATAYFSLVCDVRIIWGGDDTIAQIRQNQLPARSFDVTFADRYSFSAVNADKFIVEDQPLKIAQNFYNDTYLFDQNACSAPHLMVWLGNETNVAKSKEVFWKSLEQVVHQKYHLQPVIAIDKLTALYFQASQMDSIHLEPFRDNNLWRVQLDTLPQNIDEFRCAGGYFSEFHAQTLDEIIPIVNRKYQTMAFYGFDKEQLEAWIRKSKPVGIDRIVPIGRTSDFSLLWDGYDLIETLSRNCDILAK